MTTKAAEAAYLAAHLAEWSGKGYAVYNPNDKPIEALPVIYGFNNGGGSGMLMAQLIAEDGEALGGHCCSSEGYMPYDLGIVEGARADRHELFRTHYPEGYRMDFVPWDHPAIDRAIKLNAAKREAAARTEGGAE